MGICSLSFRSFTELLKILENCGTYSLGNRDRNNSLIRKIVRNNLAYLAVVKAHYMARKLQRISKDVQDDIQQATAVQFSALTRSTDEIDQV